MAGAQLGHMPRSVAPRRAPRAAWCVMFACAPFACAQPQVSANSAIATTFPRPIRQPGHAAASPTADAVAYVMGDSLVVATGSRRKVISRAMIGEATSPIAFLAWSREGRFLVYRAGWGAQLPGGGIAPGRLMIYDRLADTTGPLMEGVIGQRLVTFQNSQADGPRWSPDQSRRVAFLAMGQRGGSGLQAFVSDANGLKQVTAGRPRFSIAWSPRGRWIATTFGEFRSGSAGVELLDVENDFRRVAGLADTSGLLRGLFWSDDGRWLVMQDRNRRTLLVEFSGGSNPSLRLVSDTLPRLRYVAWMPGKTALVAVVPDGMATQLVQVSVPSGAMARLTTGPEVKDVIGVVSAPSPAIVFRSESGGTPRSIWNAPILPSGMLGAPFRMVGTAQEQIGIDARIFRWRSADGDTLEAQVLSSPSSPTTDVPAVVIPYGGYRNAFPDETYFLDAMIRPLLQRGYVVILPNTRGTASDGRDQDRYGAVQLEDTERMLDAMAGLDQRRVALLGHSHGGAMVYYYMTHSARFCAGAAVNGRADWVLQAHHGDGLLPGILGGSPETLADRYARFSPAANARAVAAPMMLVAGELDTQMLPDNVRIMSDSLRAAGKPHTAIVFPDESHLIDRPENRMRLWTSLDSLLTTSCR